MFVFSESVLDDVLLEALVLWLCSGSVTVDGVLLDAMFLWRCWESQSVDDVLLEEVL